MVNHIELKAADTPIGTLVMSKWQSNVVLHFAQCCVSVAFLDRQIE